MHHIAPSLAPDTRRRILELLTECPGLHLREIARRLEVPIGTALHHLDRLHSAGQLVPRRDGRYKRFFPPATVDRRDRDAISTLRRATPLRIVHALLAEGPLTQRQLVERLALSRSTLSPQLARLTLNGLLVRHPAYPEDAWSVAQPAETERLLAHVTHAPREAVT